MRWRYWIEWLDGSEAQYDSNRFHHAGPKDDNLVIWINEHGHNGRFDEVCVPLIGVKRYTITEIR